MLDSEDIGLPVIRANNINNGYVDLENDIKYWYQIDPMGANTRNYLVAKDDILINFINSESRMGSAAIMRSIPSRDTIYTTNILRLRLTSDLDPYWFYIQTQSKLYLEYIKSISKVAVNQASFTTVEFKNFTFFCPSTKEQTQIGNFFKQLDDTIALHQREFEKFKILRKAYLKHIFIDDTTQFRAEKTIPWEQRKLGEIVDVFDGTHQTPKYTDKGIMFLSVEDIKTLKSEKYISEEDFKKEFKYFPEIGDVLMTRIGDVGTTNVICSTQPIAYYVSLALLKNKNSDPYFLSTVISSGSVQSDIWKRTLHIAFPKKINKSEIEKVIIPLPSYVEQTQIGNFFKQLDDTIALHQKELAKYQQIKTACLEKMFVE